MGNLTLNAWVMRNCRFSAIAAGFAPAQPKAHSEDLLQYLTKVFPKIVNRLSSMGVDVSTLKPIGSGDHGTAYSDGNIVVKITDDHQEANTSAHMINKPVQGVNQIMYVGTLPAVNVFYFDDDELPTPMQYFVIVQKKLNTDLNAVEKGISKLVGDFMSENYSKVQWPVNMEQLKVQLGDYGKKKGLAGYLNMPGAMDIVEKIIGSLNNMKNRGIKLLDIGPRNVGKDEKGDLNLMDLGISHAPKIDLPSV